MPLHHAPGGVERAAVVNGAGQHPLPTEDPLPGTTDVVFEPLDFIARLAALVPTPRVNLTRYHGVFAPNSRLREEVTPARRGRRQVERAEEPPPARHVSMTWAQRLNRVFKIDITTCELWRRGEGAREH